MVFESHWMPTNFAKTTTHFYCPILWISIYVSVFEKHVYSLKCKYFETNSCSFPYYIISNAHTHQIYRICWTIHCNYRSWITFPYYCLTLYYWNIQFGLKHNTTDFSIVSIFKHNKFSNFSILTLCHVVIFIHNPPYATIYNHKLHKTQTKNECVIVIYYQAPPYCVKVKVSG